MENVVKALAEKVGITEAQAAKAIEVLKSAYGDFTQKSFMEKASDTVENVVDKAQDVVGDVVSKIKNFFDGDKDTK